jgi:hypothetical protein
MGLSGEKFASRLAGLIAGSRALPTMVLPLLGDRIQEGSPSASLSSCDAFQRRGMPHYRLEILRRASAFGLTLARQRGRTSRRRALRLEEPGSRMRTADTGCIRLRPTEPHPAS